MKWLDTIGSVVRWLLGYEPPPAAPPTPKQPLTPRDLGWDQEVTKPSRPPPRGTP